MAGPAVRKKGATRSAVVAILVLLVSAASPAAAVMAQFRNMTTATTVTALSTEPAADEAFALPAGYTKK
jgi:uncharacterized membrane protein